jgi:hypothetical protein
MYVHPNQKIFLNYSTCIKMLMIFRIRTLLKIIFKKIMCFFTLPRIHHLDKTTIQNSHGRIKPPPCLVVEGGKSDVL